MDHAKHYEAYQTPCKRRSMPKVGKDRLTPGVSAGGAADAHNKRVPRV